MIAFSTLLLGLVLGNYPVKVEVGPQVKSVEYRLDNVAIGTITGEPWTLWCNFGTELHPHQLVVFAKDASGKVVGRAQQWVNVPRPSAEAHILLEKSTPEKTVVAARIICDSVKYAKPSRVIVTLDGERLQVKDPDRIELPPYDSRQIHVITAELRFANDLYARAYGVFGGDVMEEERTELTAVPVVLDSIKALPPVDQLQGWFAAGNQELKVVGTELGVIDLVVVFDQSAESKLLRVWRIQEAKNQTHFRLPNSSKDGNSLYVQFAVAEAVLGKDGYARSLLPVSQPLALNMDMLFPAFASFSFPSGEAKQQRLANAVALAGQSAAGHNQRRAVILVANELPPDASTFKPDIAQAYLRDLHVPLFVWSLAGEEEAAPVTTTWGQVEGVGNTSLFDGAVARLKQVLAAQRIVWIDGAHLPQNVHLTQKAKGIRIVS